MTPTHDAAGLLAGEVEPPALLAVRTRPWLALAAGPPIGRSEFVQGVLPLSFPLADGLDAAPHSRALTVVRDDAPGVPSAKVWASRFLQAVVEVVASERPLPQLARWTAPDVYEAVARAQRAVAARRRDSVARTSRPYVASVHVCQLRADTAEVAARVVGGRRSRALAARLDFERDRWTCTALHFG